MTEENKLRYIKHGGFCKFCDNFTHNYIGNKKYNVGCGFGIYVCENCFTELERIHKELTSNILYFKDSYNVNFD